MNEQRLAAIPIVIVLSMLALSCQAGTSPSAGGGGAAVWSSSVDRAVALARAQDKRILVDLYAEWCGWCKQLDKEVFSTPEFRDYARRFVLLRVNVEDGGPGTALQARFGVESLPTTLVLDQDLVKIAELRGYAPMPRFTQKLDAEIATYEAFLRYYETVRRSDDPAVLSSLAQQLRERGDGRRAGVVYEKLRPTLADGGAKEAWLDYLTADAYRLGGRLADAFEMLKQARAHSQGQADLAERIDLLSVQIAQDAHDCDKARTSLEYFLETHPRSSFRQQAEAALTALKQGRGMACA